MSDRDAFVAARSPRWKELEERLRPGRRRASDWWALASLYRAVCADLARAQALELGDDVRAYLDELAGRAHNQLYGSRAASGLGLGALLGRDFPRAVRREWRFFLLASLLFYGPMLLGVIGCLVDPDFALTVLPEGNLAQLEAMYADDGEARPASADPAMAGFYVWNNVGIAFRCFATGALFGLGSVFYLVYNGLMLGIVQGWLAAVGLGDNLLAFVAGHGPWELTGVVVAGTGGLRMGWAVVETGGRTRLGALRAVAGTLYALVVGATALLLVAAMIEGFWSATPMPPPVKWAFGLVQVAIVASWLLLGGRGAR